MHKVVGAALRLTAALALTTGLVACGGGSSYTAAESVACVKERRAASGFRVSATAPSLTVLHLGGAPIQAQRVTLSFLRAGSGSASGAIGADVYFLPDTHAAGRFRDGWFRNLPSTQAGRLVQQRRNVVVVWGRAPGERLLHATLGCLRSR